MYTSRSTAHRFGVTFLSVAAAALVVFTLAAPGQASLDAPTATACASVCIDADGAFGPTVPVSLNEESADQFAAILGGDSEKSKSITMDFMSVDEGTEVVVLQAGTSVATVQLPSGRVAFLPVAWIQSA